MDSSMFMVASSAGPVLAGQMDCSASVDSGGTRNTNYRHSRQFAPLIDRFFAETRKLDERAKDQAPRTAATTMVSDRLVLALRTVDLLRRCIGNSKWKSPAQLLQLLRAIGMELDQHVGALHEPVMANIARRVMAAVREEATRLEITEHQRLTNNPATANNSSNSNSNNNNNTSHSPASAQSSALINNGRLSLQSMLWALPQHVRSTTSSSRTLETASPVPTRKRQESLADGDFTDLYPESFYKERSGSDLKSSIMEAIDEIINEFEDLHKNINEQAVNHIHSGEIILTTGRSKTVELFLKAAAGKKLTFQVIVCEGAPQNHGHAMAQALAEVGIDTTVISDAAVFAVMARVNKVILPAHAVLANGGMVASSGCNLVALAAKQNAVPVVCTAGLFKLCPVFPHEGQDTFNDLLSPSLIMEYAERLDAEVELINPVHDLIRPEHIDLFITNVGSFQPSFIYRLLAEYYHADDWACFDP